MRRVISLLLVVLAFAPPALAQPLADGVPADAFIYVGWCGTDTLGAAFENSHLAAVINAANFKEVIDQTIPQTLAKFADEKPEALAVQQAIMPLLKHAWKRPTALFVAPGVDRKGKFEPKVAIICDAGDVAAEFHKGLDGLIESGKNKSVKSARDGNLVILTIEYDDPAAVLKPKTALRDAAPFVSALKQVDPDPVYIAFINIEQMVKQADQDNAKSPQAGKKWQAVRDGLGLSGLKRLVMTGAFAGKEWSGRMFLEAPAPRRGLLSLLGDSPIRESTLKQVPKTASYAMVKQFDLGKLMTSIRSAVAGADPKGAAEFDRGVAKASQTVGTDLPQLFGAFGDQWVIYNDAGVGGAHSEGIVIVNELRDPARVEAGLSALVATAARMTAGGPMAITAREVELGENLKVHTLTLPRGTPAWVVKNGKLYVAFTPEAVGAATLVGTPAVAAGNVMENDKFAALRQQLGADRMTGFEFADLMQSAPQSYANLQQGVAMLGMLGASQGVWVPPNMLPPLDVLKQHLTASADVTWVDDAGWHSRGISPFPGSQLLASQQVSLTGVGGTALGVSILLPSLNRARETANRVKCASNMRQIGQACLLYSNDHKGNYPDNLGELLKTQDITIEVFTCPSGDIEPPDEVMAAGVDRMAAWLDAGESPYIYVGKGMRNSAGPEDLLLYEREDDHDEDGMNMLFGDGHVEWNSMEVAQRIIAAKAAAPRN